MTPLISISSYSQQTGEKNKMAWFEWCLFIEGLPEAVAAIDEVMYVLHPTFSDPERTVRVPEHRFALYSAGWGSFGLEVRVAWKDGDSTWLDYFLDLQADAWPKKELEGPADGDTAAVYELLTRTKYRYRKLSTLARGSGLDDERVGAVLRDLEAGNYARMAYFTSPDGQPLWGATAVVGVAPVLG